MTFRLGLKRFTILFIISLALILAGSEVAFQIQRDLSDRPPTVVELVIPAGTASMVEAGDAMPSIPEEMTFVIGDILVINNQDEVDHQLGPLWIPAKSTANLVMQTPDRLAYTCTFRSSKYFGLVVKEPTTLRTRLAALGLAVPATTAILFVYSIVIWPLKPKEVGGNPEKPDVRERPVQT